ncbi:hypothetical protein IW148_002915 [Coemansia sp. RSA 1199]|nr:hypothetical protein IW148_002915 [Coemansia sp. RSA 1199]
MKVQSTILFIGIIAEGLSSVAGTGVAMPESEKAASGIPQQGQPRLFPLPPGPPIINPPSPF